MTPSNLQARRATVDDLAELRKLWHNAGLSVSALEKQLKDFQVVETPEGVLLGAVALKIEGQQGHLHSEAFKDPADADALRQRLWERARAVARNYGLHQIWTEEPAPFWRSEGFDPASAEMVRKLPTQFGEPAASWQVLKLRESTTASVSLEREFELFAQAQRENSERLVQQAQRARNVAYFILAVVVLFGIVLVLLAIVPRSKWSQLLKPKRVVAPSAQERADRTTNQASGNPQGTSAIPAR